MAQIDNSTTIQAGVHKIVVYLIGAGIVAIFAILWQLNGQVHELVPVPGQIAVANSKIDHLEQQVSTLGGRFDQCCENERNPHQ